MDELTIKINERCLLPRLGTVSHHKFTIKILQIDGINKYNYNNYYRNNLTF